MNKERALRAHRLFAYVPAKVIKSIAPLFQEHSLERGRVVIDHGEPSQLFWLVHRGRVKTLYRHRDEFERGAGEFFGENAVLGEQSTVENAFTLQAGTELLSINRTDWNHCLNAFPVLSTAVTNIVAEALGGDGVGGAERSVGNYTVGGLLVRREREVWFSGEHSSLQRTLRLQCIPHVFMRDAKYRERLISKLKVIANLNEPFIVRPLDVVKALATYFIVYDCEDGVPLSEILTKVRSIPPAVITAVVLAAGEILAFLHAQELIHTDVRPENVLLTRSGEVKIANIGITHPDFLAPEFAAPEQMQKKHVGKGADVYALGVLAYLLAAQRCPFESRDEKALLKQKLDREYADLARINPQIPPALAEFVGRALEPRPDKRLENLSNLRDLFRLWQEPKRGKDKRHAAPPPAAPGLEVASREEIVRWLAKKYFQNESRKPEPGAGPVVSSGRNGRDTFAPLFENPDDFYAFKLLTFEDFAADSFARKTELAVTFKKDELLAHLHELERERQELIVAHVLLKKMKKCATRRDLFDILSRLLAAVEKPARWALLARKDKKIKNLAERVAVGSAYEPEPASDRVVIEKAEDNAEPFLLREKNHFILVCPLATKTKFIGSICVADRVKKDVDARLRFYKLVAEVVPVVELEW